MTKKNSQHGKKKGFLRRNAALILILLCGVISGSTAGAYLALSWDLPQIRELEDFTPSAVTRIYSRDNVLLAELFVEKRIPVPIETIPEYLKTALLAMEDRSFRKHSGIDLRGIARAIVTDIRAGRIVEGASTITQQLAKTLFLTPKKTIVRKLREMLLAFQMERRYTKDEILALYLNQVYFGSGAYGVESAARIFFGKTAGEMTLAECALVAAMPRLPSKYSPLVDPELSVRRRNIVLKVMRNIKKITEAQYQEAVNEPLNLNKTDDTGRKAPWFVAHIKKRLENTLGSSMLYKGGLTIRTTLSHAMQQQAEEAVSNRLDELEARMARNGITGPDPEAALVCTDVRTGGILAMVGGGDFNKNAFNRATKARRQPGSAFKPFVYALAIEQGFAQNKLILDAPVVFRAGRKGRDWRPENYSGSYLGEITMRKALALSKNIPAVRLIEMLGPASVIRFANGFGINSPLSSNLSLVLGTSEVSLLELTSAYAVFPNRGKRIAPFGVADIQDRNGRTIWRAKPEIGVAMSETGAAVMTDMLRAVITEGTGRSAKIIGKPIAGKTGTTDKNRDALFVGFSPEITTGVWVGRDEYKTLGKGETGARAALPIWIDFMSKALAESEFEYFDTPADTVRVAIDPDSGQPVPAGSDNAVSVLFKTETKPQSGFHW